MSTQTRSLIASSKYVYSTLSMYVIINTSILLPLQHFLANQMSLSMQLVKGYKPGYMFEVHTEI